MIKVKIGHFVKAQILEALNIDYVDESEVLYPAANKYHLNKANFKIPFVCEAKNLGEALVWFVPGIGDVLKLLNMWNLWIKRLKKLQYLLMQLWWYNLDVTIYL